MIIKWGFPPPPPPPLQHKQPSSRLCHLTAQKLWSSNTQSVQAVHTIQGSENRRRHITVSIIYHVSLSHLLDKGKLDMVQWFVPKTQLTIRIQGLPATNRCLFGDCNWISLCNHEDLFLKTYKLRDSWTRQKDVPFVWSTSPKKKKKSNFHCLV